MTMAEKEIVNNLNKTALLAVKQKMVQDQNLGALAPVLMKAVWKEGVVKNSAGSLVSYPPPEIQMGVTKGPSMNAYCPLLSGGCFSLVLMMQAAEKDLHFDSMTTRTTSNADFQCFYKNEDGLPSIWKEGIHLDFFIESKTTPTPEINELAVAAENHCPAAEMLRREFPVKVEPLVTIPLESSVTADIPHYYDMDQYEKIANTQGPHIVKQEASMTWHCQNESEKYPDALMTFSFPTEANAEIPLGFDPPIGAGKYASPVAVCFFGGLSTHLHTVAARIYHHGYKIKEMRGEIRSTMNKRKVMAVETDSYIFPEGATIGIEIETDAPEDVVRAAELEANNMSPSQVFWRNVESLEYAVNKQ